MDNIFFLKLLLSFLVGGLTIAVLSFWAERSNSRVAGIIISLPTTLVISYLFIGWTISANAVVTIVPTSIITDGAVLIFTVAYFYFARLHLGKFISIFTSAIGAILVWLLLTIPFALMKFSSLPISLLGYSIMVLISYYFLTLKNQCQIDVVAHNYTWPEKIGRAVFVGLIIAMTVYLANVLHPFWGGVFSCFPAAFSSTFIILHWYYGPRMISKIVKAVPIGSIPMIGFLLSVYYLMPILGLIIGTVISYLITILIFLIITKLQKRT